MPTGMTCEVCEKTAEEGKHPCRFEKSCRCWYGDPCVNGETMRQWKKSTANTHTA